ncbi:MAG: LPS-assembly protein LptD [Treponema sp.]|nr:LPS-assembly protein LptD [Treponema sp.]
MKSGTGIRRTVVLLFLLGFLVPSPLFSQDAAGETASGEAPGETAAAESVAVETATGTVAVESGTAESGGAESGAAAGSSGGIPAAEALPLSPEQNLIDMDIKTSSLTELAAWCRSLGLSEGGTRTELARRLREYFRLPPSGAAEEEDKRKIITIESARSTEYFRLEIADEDYARLSGDVRISLKDGDAIHRIRASGILFNRTRNILTATGGVEYIKEAGETVETFRGESITVNLDNWESIFLDGVSERKLQSDSTMYRFSGTVISRNDEEVTVLNKASISNGNNPEALWSLNASRVWLLPGSDFAIFNAVLKVGEIPVMYIPFFYYPADEVLFHPVIGFRTREGSFVQTTTYILGRPKADSASQSSLTRILGSSSDMEKKRQGIFLRSTGKKVTDPGATTLKAIVDYYTNLGAYLGAELNTPKLGILNTLDLSFGIGFTRTIIRDAAGNYTPFTPSDSTPPTYDGSSDWNKTNLFSQEVPFRYRLKTGSSISGKYGNLSWNFPYYSDPNVDNDFIINRAEEMDWVNMIQKGAAVEEDETTATTVGAYQWQLTGSLKPSFPILAPYVSSVTLSSFSTTVAFKTRNMTASSAGGKYPSYFYTYSPSRSFFYPDTATLYSANGSIAGTPLTLGAAGTAAGNQPASGAQSAAQGAAQGAGQSTGQSAGEPRDPFKDIGVPRSPWEKAAGEQDEKISETDKLVPPVLEQRFDMPQSGTARFSIDYRITPTSASELQFRSSESNWAEYGDIDWNEISSILSTAGGDASTTFNLNHSGGFYTNAFTLSGNGTWRQYSYINEEAESYVSVPPGSPPGTPPSPDEAKINQAREQQYRQSFFTTSYGYTGTVRPLYRDSIWGQSNLQYSLKGIIAKSDFTGTGEDPDWEIQYGEWDKEKLETHQFATNLAAAVMEKQQNFTLSADLPPRDPSISGNATFRVWLTEINAHMRIANPGEEDKRKFEPFYSTETLKYGTWGSRSLVELVHYMVLDTELKEFTTITTKLTLLDFIAEYTVTRTQGYDFNPNLGWVQKKEDPSLKPRDFTLSYVKTFGDKTKRELWKKRLGFSVDINTRLFFDLQRYTNSSFRLTLGFTLGITNFIDLSFSTTSENAVIFRYFKDLPMFDDFPMTLPEGEQNDFFTDLANSFRFDDESRRRSSGFKMKSFTLAATHHLGDWNAVLGVTMSPYLPENTRQYQFNTEVSFVVRWIPITEIKSDISYNKKNDEWIVK